MVARNQLGQATATVRVVLGDISTSPESPVVEAMTDTDILISWKTPAALNHTPVICYKVQMGYIGKYMIFTINSIGNIGIHRLEIVEYDKHQTIRIVCQNIKTHSDRITGTKCQYVFSMICFSCTSRYITY